MPHNEPHNEGTIMYNLPRAAVITIKIIDAIDSKFDRFRRY